MCVFEKANWFFYSSWLCLYIKRKKTRYDIRFWPYSFFLPETLLKKQITSREEFEVEYQLNECFFLIEKNLISTVVLDTSLFTNSKSSSLNLSCLLTVLENLGRNPYLKRVFLVAENSLQFSLFSKMIADLEKKSPLLNNFSL